MSSSVPAAVPAFIAICQAALPTGFLVKEGSVFGPYAAQQALLVTGLHFTQDSYAELGPNYKHEEHYNIQCALSVVQGNDDQASVLTTVYSFYNPITVAVANNLDLNHTTRLGWCRQLDYQMGYDAVKGWTIGTLRFEVEVQARVTSLS
jgi:hypothetical protein